MYLRLLALLPLCSCSALLTQSAGAGAGVGGAAIANAVTKNGAVTAGIGLGAQALATTGVQVLEKRVHRTEQDSIAAAAGPLSIGSVTTWSVSHTIPIEANEHGELTVIANYTPNLPTGGAAPFDCKQIIFSVDTKAQQDFYTAFVCRDSTQWKWATAEPATERWGALQ